MRKTLLTTLAAALAASAAFAEVPLKALQDLPKDAYIPADVTFIRPKHRNVAGPKPRTKLAKTAPNSNTRK